MAALRGSMVDAGCSRQRSPRLLKDLEAYAARRLDQATVGAKAKAGGSAERMRMGGWGMEEDGCGMDENGWGGERMKRVDESN